MGLIISEKTFSSYWNKSAQVLSDRLLSLIKTGLSDLDLRSLNGLPLNTMRKSWFLMTVNYLHNKNLSQISCLSSMFSRTIFMDSDHTVRRSKKIRIYPTKRQERVLNNMLGASRYFFNKTIAYVRDKKCYPNRFAIQREILSEVPEWAETVPYKVKQMAIDDACKSYISGFKKRKKDGKRFSVSFRRKKDRSDSFYIPKQLVDGKGFYKRSLGVMRYSEKFEEVHYDCRVVFQKGYYFIILPYDKKVKHPESQRMRVVSLDPGVRTFQTLFSPLFSAKIGTGDFKRIYRQCLSLDKLISRKSKSRKYQPVIDRVRFRIKNKISEIHNKLSVFLCKSFDNIVIPEFKAQSMVNKLRSKTARSMLTWAHSEFRRKLILKAEEYSCNIILVNEAYTSKTCSYCGKVNNIGSKKTLKCSCGITEDRDINGARGIFLLAMSDPALSGMINNC